MTNEWSAVIEFYTWCRRFISARFVAYRSRHLPIINPVVGIITGDGARPCRDVRCRRQLEVPKGLDAMKLGLSNFQPVAASEIIEQEVLDLGDVEQLTAPMIESDR